MFVCIFFFFAHTLLRAFRRKKALHDIHVTTSKFNPRALSPHTRQALSTCWVERSIENET